MPASKKKPCPKGARRSPATHRCKKSSKKSAGSCGAGKARSRTTGRCHSSKKSVKRASSKKRGSSKKKKPCPRGQAHSRETGRCHLIRKPYATCEEGKTRDRVTHRCRWKLRDTPDSDSDSDSDSDIEGAANAIINLLAQEQAPINWSRPVPTQTVYASKPKNPRSLTVGSSPLAPNVPINRSKPAPTQMVYVKPKPQPRSLTVEPRTGLKPLSFASTPASASASASAPASATELAFQVAPARKASMRPGPTATPVRPASIRPPVPTRVMSQRAASMRSPVPAQESTEGESTDDKGFWDWLGNQEPLV